MEPERPRISARVLLFDDSGRVVLIRRSRIGEDSYLTTPGGGVQPDETLATAAARECREELGADVTVGHVVFIAYSVTPASGIQYVHLGRLDSIDQARRTGLEFAQPERGGYETVRIDLSDAEALASLRPPELRTILAGHGRYLASEAAALD